MDEIHRENVEGLRKSLKKHGMVIAEVDHELKYVWIENPHSDFDAADVVGKRDDQLISKEDAKAVMSFKRKVLASGEPAHEILSFKRSDGLRDYTIFAYPIRNEQGVVDGLVTVGFDVPHRVR
jgi:hypothetical protein